MKSAMDKNHALSAMMDSAGTPDSRMKAGILVALIEIREAIEQGFARLDETIIEGGMWLGGCKESFDGYVEDRLKADKVLAGVVAAANAKKGDRSDAIENERARRAVAVSLKDAEDAEKPADPVDEPKKSAVTLNVGDFGGPVSESGIA